MQHLSLILLARLFLFFFPFFSLLSSIFLALISLIKSKNTWKRWKNVNAKTPSDLWVTSGYHWWHLLLVVRIQSVTHHQSEQTKTNPTNLSLVFKAKSRRCTSASFMVPVVQLASTVCLWTLSEELKQDSYRYLGFYFCPHFLSTSYILPWGDSGKSVYILRLFSDELQRLKHCHH